MKTPNSRTKPLPQASSTELSNQTAEDQAKGHKNFWQKLFKLCRQLPFHRKTAPDSQILIPPQATLDDLPVDLLMIIGDELPLESAAAFTLTTKHVYGQLGSHYFDTLKEAELITYAAATDVIPLNQRQRQRRAFLQLLDLDIPTTIYCHYCQILHPPELSKYGTNDRPCARLNLCHRFLGPDWSFSQLQMAFKENEHLCSSVSLQAGNSPLGCDMVRHHQTYSYGFEVRASLQCHPFLNRSIEVDAIHTILLPKPFTGLVPFHNAFEGICPHWLTRLPDGAVEYAPGLNTLMNVRLLRKTNKQARGWTERWNTIGRQSRRKHECMRCNITFEIYATTHQEYNIVTVVAHRRFHELESPFVDEWLSSFENLPAGRGTSCGLRVEDGLLRGIEEAADYLTYRFIGPHMDGALTWTSRKKHGF